MRSFGKEVLSKLRLRSSRREPAEPRAPVLEVRFGEGAVYLDLDRDEYACCYDPRAPVGMYRSLVASPQGDGADDVPPIAISPWRERSRANPQPSAVDIARFVVALTKAGIQFHGRSLRDLGILAGRLDGVPCRKPVRAGQVANLFALLLAMSPLRPKCLFGSFFLLHFLNLYGVRADWIFGVQLFPFRAHCWLAADGELLNETPHAIEYYKVIWIADGGDR